MISDNLRSIERRIAEACARSGRDAGEVTLVAIAKTFPADMIREAVRAGVADVGENYMQELLEKRRQLAGENIRWHFVGHLQSNKVKLLAEWVSLVHALDSLPLAEEIDRRAGRAQRMIDVLVEVNTTGEKSKFGVDPGQAEGFVRSLENFPNIRIAGLMTIGPFLPDPEGSRPAFSLLRRLKEDIARSGQANVAMKHLSMGMSGDFEVAIEEGATLVRIGTAIFGPRKKRTSNGGLHEAHAT